MTQTVALNQQDVFVTVRMITDADGTPATGVVAATAGHQIWYRRDGAADVDDGTSAANLASLTTAHTDWEFLHIRAGYYTVAFPDAAFLEGVGSVLCGMEATGISCIAEKVDLQALFKYQGTASSVTALTTTFPAGTDPDVGDVIVAIEGTGIKQQVLVTDVTGQVATHEAWQRTNISATTTTLLLIGGDDVTARGGIDIDALISSRATPSQVNSECDQAIVDATLATSTQLTTVQNKTDQLNFTGNNVQADMVKVAGGADIAPGGLTKPEYAEP